MDERAPVQTAARAAGIVFLVVGIAGFVPGLTTNLYEGLDFAGSGGEAELLGVFGVSVLHNLVHLLFGVGIFLSATPDGAKTYLYGSGIAYGALFLLGVVGGGDWVPLDSADNLLHLALALALTGLAYATTR
jgi:hypothetical protein